MTGHPVSSTGGRGWNRVGNQVYDSREVCIWYSKSVEGPLSGLGGIKRVVFRFYLIKSAKYLRGRYKSSSIGNYSECQILVYAVLHFLWEATSVPRAKITGNGQN